MQRVYGDTEVSLSGTARLQLSSVRRTKRALQDGGSFFDVRDHTFLTKALSLQVTSDGRHRQLSSVSNLNLNYSQNTYLDMKRLHSFALLLFLPAFSLIASTYDTSDAAAPAEHLVLTASASSERNLSHGPYLQEVTTDGATIVYETLTNAFSWIEIRKPGSTTVTKYYGSHYGLLDANTTHFAIRAASLEPGTTYQYRIATKQIDSFQPYKVTFASSTPTYTNWFTFDTVDPNKTTHSLFITSDMHNRPKVLERLLRGLDFATCDHIIYAGDMEDYMQTSSEEPYSAFIDKSVELFASRKPFQIVRGNHETRGDMARNFSYYFPRVSGQIYAACRWGDLEMIFLDCGEDKADTNSEYSGLVDFFAYRTQEAEWLKQVIASEDFKTAKYRIVVSHYAAPARGASGWAGYQDFEDKMLPLLKNAGIDLMVAGHTHPKTCVEVPVNDAGKGNTYPVIIQGYYSATRIDISADGKIKVKVLGTDGTTQLEKTYQHQS